MLNSFVSKQRLVWIAGGALFIGLFAVVVLLILGKFSDTDHGELERAEVELKDGALFLKGSDEAFSGTLVEYYSPEVRKLSIRIQNGRAHGLSRGWHENGQMEVEETFVNGVSNGVRTRWYANGAKKSEAKIVDGAIVGLFRQWHDNGVKAAEVNMENGQAHGIAEAWYPSGALKSRVPYENGEAGEAVFFPDETPAAGTEPSN